MKPGHGGQRRVFIWREMPRVSLVWHRRIRKAQQRSNCSENTPRSELLFLHWLTETDTWQLILDIHRLLLIKKVFLKSRIMHLSLVWVYYYYFLFFSQAPKKQKQKKQKCLPKIPKLPHPHNILYVTRGRQCGSASSQLGGIYWSTATLAIHPHRRRLVSTKPWCTTITPYFTIQHR